MKKDIQNLSDNGWNGIDAATKQRLKSLYPINILQDISDNGWNGIDDATKDTVRSIFSPENLRESAKKEYASDVLQQDSINTVEIKQIHDQIWKENVYIPSILILFVFLYFLPTYICFKRKVSRKKTSMVFFLNLFSGWTFFMWLVLGIWSLSDFELK